MKLEFCYRGYLIKLFSYAKAGGWVPQCQAVKSAGDKEEVHMLVDPELKTDSTLRQANQMAKQQAKVWIDQKERPTRHEA